ncbi:MAG TPA: tRNA (adenosine(37)-N6)-dimethylallyltransferase MiaA, partial [Chloroflexota bacterium]
MKNLTGAPPVVVITGPTAVGKSSLALRLAPRFGASIVSADSRQIYRYMDIGTAKATLEERAAVPHYMLDLIQPNENFSAQRYRAEGQAVLSRIGHDGGVAFVVGGTGFYLRALLDQRTFPAVPPDENRREEMRAEAQTKGPEILHERLLGLDPASAERIHPANVARVIRALEIVESLNAPVPPLEDEDEHSALFLGLTMHRDRLRARADSRAEEQVSAGLVQECGLLLAMGYDSDAPALQGFGYRHIIRYLSGACSLEVSVADYKTATHQYIRRQMTWFRKQPRIRWIEESEDVEDKAAR